MRIPSLVLWFLPAFLLSLTGCEIINPEEDTPSYIKINNFTLDPDRSSAEDFGSASHNITDAWVFANGKSIGVFELPATIPILESGPTEFAIFAGVFADGLRASRFPYAYYTEVVQTVNLTPGQVLELKPVVKIRPEIKFPLDINEDFSGKAEFRVQPGNPYSLKTNTDTLTDFQFADGAVGVIYADTTTVQAAVIESFFDGSLPNNGRAVFLEFDYKATVDFKVGVLVTRNGQTTRDPNFLNVRSRNSWNKIYLNLTDDANRPDNTGGTFKIFFEMPASKNSKDYVALDNIRLFHF